MASRRDLKKDIRALYANLLEECLTDAVLYRDADRQKLDAAFQEITTRCRDFLSRASHTDGAGNPKQVKAYYRKLGEEMLKNILDITRSLENVREQ